MYREVDMYVRFGKTGDIYSVERTKTKNQDLGSGRIYRKTRSGEIFGNKEHLDFRLNESQAFLAPRAWIIRVQRKMNI